MLVFHKWILYLLYSYVYVPMLIQWTLLFPHYILLWWSIFNKECYITYLPLVYMCLYCVSVVQTNFVVWIKRTNYNYVLCTEAIIQLIFFFNNVVIFIRVHISLANGLLKLKWVLHSWMLKSCIIDVLLKVFIRILYLWYWWNIVMYYCISNMWQPQQKSDLFTQLPYIFIFSHYLQCPRNGSPKCGE